MGDSLQRWRLRREDHEHVVEVTSSTLTSDATWLRDGESHATKKTSGETLVLAVPGGGAAVRLRLTKRGTTRRVTLHASAAEARTGLGGIDFAPEAGSKAAQRIDWIGRHPHLHTVRQTAVAAAGVLVPLILIWLLAKVPWPDVDVPWPDLPSIPWPDVDLPSIPWPDVDLPDLPGLPTWLEPARRFIVPIIIAFFIAHGEVRRRRKHEAERVAVAQAATEGAAAEGAQHATKSDEAGAVDVAGRGDDAFRPDGVDDDGSV